MAELPLPHKSTEIVSNALDDLLLTCGPTQHLRNQMLKLIDQMRSFRKLCDVKICTRKQRQLLLRLNAHLHGLGKASAAASGNKYR